MLFSIGLVFMAVAAFTFFYGPSPQRVVMPISSKARSTSARAPFPSYRVFLIAVGLGLMAALWLLFERTLIGARIRAAVDAGAWRSRSASTSRRCSPDLRLRQRSRRVGGGLAADIIGLSPTFAIQYLVFFLIVVTVGGAGSLWGAFVAALLLGFLDNAGKYLWPDGGASSSTSRPWRSCCTSRIGLFGRAYRP